jgi:hypothetical protein
MFQNFHVDPQKASVQVDGHAEPEDEDARNERYQRGGQQ